jgi:hypothetical protein
MQINIFTFFLLLAANSDDVTTRKEQSGGKLSWCPFGRGELSWRPFGRLPFGGGELAVSKSHVPVVGILQADPKKDRKENGRKS